MIAGIAGSVLCLLLLIVLLLLLRRRKSKKAQAATGTAVDDSVTETDFGASRSLVNGNPASDSIVLTFQILTTTSWVHLLDRMVRGV